MTKIVLNLKKGICGKPPANIIENDKRLNAFILDQEQARKFSNRNLELKHYIGSEKYECTATLDKSEIKEMVF